MFSKRLSDLKDTLSIRLTFWYAAIFICSSVLILFIFYQRVVAVTMGRTDADLTEEIGEWSEELANDGLEKVRLEMLDEAAMENPENIFLQLYRTNGKLLISTDSTTWGDLQIDSAKLKMLRHGGSPMLVTKEIPAKKHKARVVIGYISPSMIMQIGKSLQDNEEFIDIFRKLLLMLLLPVFMLATLMGWLMAKKALLGVEEVAQTAEEIAGGAYDKRVSVNKKTIEIDRLADAFNRMVDRLQALIRGMREMTDNFAHDLRSPLTRIRGIAEMTLMKNSTDGEFREMAVNTIEECDNLILMINTMLDITETESGAARMQMTTVDLNELIQEACGLFDNIAREKGISLTSRLADQAIIKGDRAKLQRLITNLLENAIKYTPPSGKVIISVERQDDQLIMRFEDTGIGIPPEELPRVFERFYRCDKSRSESGIGLGLNLAKAIAEAFSGTIAVDSTPMRGSVFTVTLPC
jgi:heavy metal sensor kinase